jgi:hypothetical protein
LNDTIEHILPQEKSNSWNHFNDYEHKELKNTIGNLCLLSPRLNGEASNKGFSDKKITYKKAGMIIYNDIIYDDKEKERLIWDQKSIKDRSEQLIKFAKEQWKDL